VRWKNVWSLRLLTRRATCLLLCWIRPLPPPSLQVWRKNACSLRFFTRRATCLLLCWIRPLLPPPLQVWRKSACSLQLVTRRLVRRLARLPTARDEALLRHTPWPRRHSRRLGQLRPPQNLRSHSRRLGQLRPPQNLCSQRVREGEGRLHSASRCGAARAATQFWSAARGAVQSAACGPRRTSRRARSRTRPSLARGERGVV